MFKNWSPQDWAAVLTLLGALGVFVWGAVWLMGRRLGKFETEHQGMKDDIVDLKAKAEKHSALDTAVALLVQGQTTMQNAFVQLRDEIREDRREGREAFDEIRGDVKFLLSGRRSTPRRSTRRTPDA